MSGLKKQIANLETSIKEIWDKKVTPKDLGKSSPEFHLDAIPGVFEIWNGKRYDEVNVKGRALRERISTMTNCDLSYYLGTLLLLVCDHMERSLIDDEIEPEFTHGGYAHLSSEFELHDSVFSVLFRMWEHDSNADVRKTISEAAALILETRIAVDCYKHHVPKLIEVGKLG